MLLLRTTAEACQGGGAPRLLGPSFANTTLAARGVRQGVWGNESGEKRLAQTTTPTSPWRLVKRKGERVIQLLTASRPAITSHSRLLPTADHQPRSETGQSTQTNRSHHHKTLSRCVSDQVLHRGSHPALRPGRHRRPRLPSLSTSERAPGTTERQAFRQVPDEFHAGRCTPGLTIGARIPQECHRGRP